MRFNKIGFALGIFILGINVIIVSPTSINASQDSSSLNYVARIDTVKADIEPPSLLITEPENLSIVSGWFFLSAIATDNDSIDKVVFRNINSQSTYTVMSQNETDLSSFRAIVDSRTYQNGVNFIEIIANDTSNNINRSVLLIGVQNLEAEADVYAYNVTGLTEDCPCLNDDNTSIFWNSVESHSVLEFGGYVKFSHNFTHFFTLIVYDSSLSWVSLEFDNDGDGICMENGEDLWWFSEMQETSDYTAMDFSQPQLDTVQDVIFEAGNMVGNESNFKFFEIVRPFVTSEPEDVVFQFGAPIAIIFASSALHQGGVRANFTIAFKSQPPIDLTNTTSPFGTLPPGVNIIQDLVLYGGVGLILNVTLIIGLVFYDRKRGK
ncbi:MAG: hypothetical protein ACXAC6_10360 [Candidatus Hodarchaeales archaeon]|jgi:hypothetical protein